MLDAGNWFLVPGGWLQVAGKLNKLKKLFVLSSVGINA
jgi:hypothetical protein